MKSLKEAIDLAFSSQKIVIYAKEQFCNRYPHFHGAPTRGCAECGLGEFFARTYDPERDFVKLENDYRAFKQKVGEGAVSITLLGGEILQEHLTHTLWPSADEMINRFDIKPSIVKKLCEYRFQIGKPLTPGTVMAMWERDALLPTAMIASLGAIPHITSNFDLLRPTKGKESKRLEEVVMQLKIAGLRAFNVSWHTAAGTTLSQNIEYFEGLVTAIKFCERKAKIPTILTRVFRGFQADPDIFLWQREVANRYITNDISPAEISSEDRKTVFYSSNQELKPTPEEVEILELFHLINNMVADQPRVKTVFQSIFEDILAETGWRCNPAEEHFEFIDTTAGGTRNGVCSEVRGKVANLFPHEQSARMEERVKLIHELCPSCLSRCYTYFEWREFQKDTLHLWHYTQMAGKIWRQMYGRRKPYRHLVTRAEDYMNPDLLERILQFRFRYLAKSLENEEIVAMLKRSGVSPIMVLTKYYQEAKEPAVLIRTMQQYFSGLPEFSDEKTLQSRVMRKVARLQPTNSGAVPIPWKYLWILRKETADELTYHYLRTLATLGEEEKPKFPTKGTILSKLIDLFLPKQSLQFAII